MKLLFDQNLSFKLCAAIADLFPESNHVGLLALSEAGDREVWDYAKAHNFTIVSQDDADFAEMAAVLGSPPKVIWLRAGNQSTPAISTTTQHVSKSTSCFYGSLS